MSISAHHLFDLGLSLGKLISRVEEIRDNIRADRSGPSLKFVYVMEYLSRAYESLLEIDALSSTLDDVLDYIELLTEKYTELTGELSREKGKMISNLKRRFTQARQNRMIVKKPDLEDLFTNLQIWMDRILIATKNQDI